MGLIMIVSPKASWISLITVYGTVIQQIKLRLAAVVLIAVAATTIHEPISQPHHGFQPIYFR